MNIFDYAAEVVEYMNVAITWIFSDQVDTEDIYR